MSLNRVLYVAFLLIVLVVSALLSHHADPESGLQGWGLGVAIGGFLLLLGVAFQRRVRSADGNALLAALYASIAVSFLVIVTSAVVINTLAPAWLYPAVLTAFAIYFVHRMGEALVAWPAGKTVATSASRPSATGLASTNIHRPPTADQQPDTTSP